MQDISPTLRVALVQTQLHWEDREANHRHLEALIAQCPASDLIVLPEMFSSGFTMNAAAVAQPTPGPTLQWMQQQAATTGAVICGSIAAKDGDRYHNRLLWVEPNGQWLHYDKKHTFRMAREHEVYTPGTDWRIAQCKGWCILPLVCYDLRFPLWARRRTWQPDGSYDLLLYVANWPLPRHRHWQQLLAARAIENQAYVAGVNRVGTDANGHQYSGDTALYSYMGEVLAGTTPFAEGIAHCTLHRDELEQYRTRFPAWQDADPFELL